MIPSQHKRHYTPAFTCKHIGTGIQSVYHFENGYGASVIPEYNDYLIPIPGLWELAVTKYNPTDDDYHICYTTSITDDVIRHQTQDQIDALLDQIAGL